MHYAEVLVDVANRRLDQIFHYRIPETLILKVGTRVLVPLQHRQVQGIVLRRTEILPEGMKEGITYGIISYRFTVIACEFVFPVGITISVVVRLQGNRKGATPL